MHETPDIKAPAMITGGSREPLKLRDPAICYRVTKGSCDLFTVDGNASESRRRFAGRIPKGGVLCGLDDASSREIGMLAVGSLGSEFEVLNSETALAPAAFEGWIKILTSLAGPDRASISGGPDLETGPWELQPGETLTGHPRSQFWVTVEEGKLCAVSSAHEVAAGQTIPLVSGMSFVASERAIVTLSLRDEITAQHLAPFNRFCLAKAAARSEEARTAPPSLDQDRSKTLLARGLTELMSAMTASPEDGSAEAAADPMLWAVRRVIRALGQPMPAIPLPPLDGLAPLEHAEALFRRHHLGVRRVLLRPGWDSHDGTPLLAFLDDSDEPIALIPRGGRWYWETDGRSEPVSEDFIETLSPTALQVYPSFPNRKLTLRDFITFALGGSKGDIRRIAVCLAMGALLGTLTPFAMELLIDVAIPNGRIDTIQAVVIGLFATSLATLSFQLTNSIAMERTEARLESRVQPALMVHLLKLPTAFFRSSNIGDITDRVLGINTAREIITGTALSSLFGSAFALFSLIPILYIDARLAIYVLFATLAVGAITVTIARSQLYHQRRMTEYGGKVDGFVLQMLTGIAKLKIAAATPVAFAKWAAQFREYMALSRAAERTIILQKAVQIFVTSLALAGLLLVIIEFQKADRAAGLSRDISAGGFAAVAAGFAQIIGAISSLAHALTSTLEAVPMFERAREVLDAETEPVPEQAQDIRLKGAIDVRALGFSYVPGGAQVLTNIDLRIEQGEFVALVGGSGSGKSTLLRLLLGFERPQSGDIYYDGVSIRRLNVASLRRQIGVVLQHGKIFAGSIYNNVVGETGLGMDAANRAIKLVGLDQAIAEMPMGMHTVLLDGGSTLSGGQRQRILIARALVEQPTILMLDEATSALDNKTQTIVTETLTRLPVTRIVIAHRLSTIQAVDRIVVIDKGRVVETGTYADLMEQNGVFAALARRQLA